MLIFLFLPFLIQDLPVTKPTREFEISTKYELRRKPVSESKIVFTEPEQKEKETGTDMLPYLILNLTVKKWNNYVTHVRVIDSKNKQYLKKKVTDAGVYTWDMGYIDDIKDKVTPGKFIVQFMAEKKAVEQIIVQVEEDGTFLVNGEKRGKF